MDPVGLKEACTGTGVGVAIGWVVALCDGVGPATVDEPGVAPGVAPAEALGCVPPEQAPRATAARIATRPAPTGRRSVRRIARPHGKHSIESDICSPSPPNLRAHHTQGLASRTPELYSVFRAPFGLRARMAGRDDDHVVILLCGTGECRGLLVSRSRSLLAPCRPAGCAQSMLGEPIGNLRYTTPVTWSGRWTR